MATCLKCHRPVVDGVSICAVCNPAGLRTPAPTQFHGSMMVILCAVFILAAITATLLWGRSGPGQIFKPTFVRISAETPGSVTALVEVHNNGTERVEAKCRVVALSSDGLTVASTDIQTPPIPAGESVVVNATFATSVPVESANPTCG